MTSTEYPDLPRVAVGAVVIHQERILLVKRGKPPALDEWAIPGGNVELGETLRAAAEREILEETGVSVQAHELIYTFDTIIRDGDRIRFHYVILDFMAAYLAGEPKPGDDVQAAGWFRSSQLAGITVNQKTRDLLERIDFITPPTNR